MTHIRKFGVYIKRLNLFKVADQRTENDIKFQNISTRVYLILLTGMFILNIEESLLILMFAFCSPIE
jgi:hypothetical protein